MSKVVRLKERNPRAKQMLRRYVYRSRRYEAGKYYEVPDAVADHLATVRGVEGDEYSSLAFEVFADREAAVEAVEAAKAKTGTAANPESLGVLTTEDLPVSAAEEDARKKRAEANLDRAKSKKGKRGGKSEKPAESEPEPDEGDPFA